jgi:hypothetical protein
MDVAEQAYVQEIADHVFDSLRWTRVSDGTVQDVRSLEEWTHRMPHQIEADLAYLEINRSEVLVGLSKYLASSKLRTRELDWLFLNVLTYAEYTATVWELRKTLLGVEGAIKSVHPPKSDHSSSISDVAGRPWQFVAAGAITVISAIAHPLLAIGAGSGAVYWYMKRKNSIERVNSVIATMLRTYLSFNTVDLSWSHVSVLLDESRRAGAMWDASLFRLAEARQDAA